MSFFCSTYQKGSKINECYNTIHLLKGKQALLYVTKAKQGIWYLCTYSPTKTKADREHDRCLYSPSKTKAYRKYGVSALHSPSETKPYWGYSVNILHSLWDATATGDIALAPYIFLHQLKHTGDNVTGVLHSPSPIKALQGLVLCILFHLSIHLPSDLTYFFLSQVQKELGTHLYSCWSHTKMWNNRTMLIFSDWRKYLVPIKDQKCI